MQAIDHIIITCIGSCSDQQVWCLQFWQREAHPCPQVYFLPSTCWSSPSLETKVHNFWPSLTTPVKCVEWNLHLFYSRKCILTWFCSTLDVSVPKVSVASPIWLICAKILCQWVIFFIWFYKTNITNCSAANEALHFLPGLGPPTSTQYLASWWVSAPTLTLTMVDCQNWNSWSRCHTTPAMNCLSVVRSLVQVR